MEIARNYDELHGIINIWKNEGLTSAFVPTMGALHAGHLSLMKQAQKQEERTIVSIFVNPTQFAPHEDFENYPRDVQSDIDQLEALGINLLYLPQVTDIYPEGATNTSIQAGEAAKGLESVSRPHFFDGVVTVVKILFDQVRPDTAIFGEKDFQQLQAIKEMTTAYKLPINIIGGATIRDNHGLALSSRNAYLSPAQLQTARQLNKILRELASAIKINSEGNDALFSKAQLQIKESGFGRIDYLELRWDRILAAVWLDKTRLIDNIAL